MSKNERYDFIIVGGGPNGVGLAAYLAKCGASVCVLEERPEAGGACENTEPVPGVRLTPHAMYMYAGPAPAFEQLELHRYGFRMDWSPQSRNLADQQARGIATTAGMAPITDRDAMGWARLAGMLGQPPFTRELLRSIFWCPPHPPEVEVTPENIPYMQVYRRHQPDVWTGELLDMTMFDLMDEYLETEPVKVMHAMVAWYSGAAGHWEGVAIPALGCDVTLTIYSGLSVPRGGMHGYFHSIIRCAIAHGAVIRTCCPVDEIIIQDGRATGVRLKDSATLDEKTIRATKAVISDVDVKQTFSRLVGPRHMSASFARKVRDISIKGGSIWVSHLLTREKLRCRPKFRNPVSGDDAGLGPYPCDSREIYYEHAADVDGRRGRPTMPPERLMWLSTPGDRFDPGSDSQCTLPGRHLASPYYTYVPPPEYQVGGPDAIDREKEEMNAYLRKAFSQTIENLDEGNLIQHWANTPYESEFRNTGLIGGTWCGTRHCADQWGETRPIPELARYRTPIEALYLCNQTACHPGGLALMAIPYNLMHILIEDGLVEPGKWWYPSPWYIPQQGKIPAIPR